jgi:hypothetical protein
VRKTILAVVLLVAVLPAFLKVYFVRSDGGGVVFWDADEAYVFETVVQRGYPMSYWGYLGETIREIFPFGASSPTDTHFSVVVVRVTPELVQRYTTDNYWLGTVQPFEGALYGANLLPGGVLMKWSGTQFERPDSDELNRYYATVSNHPPGLSYDNVAGWSKRPVAGEFGVAANNTEKDAHLTIELGGRPFTFAMNSGFSSREAHIDLLRPPQAPERIWYMDGRPHRVSKSQYETTFKVGK